MSTALLTSEDSKRVADAIIEAIDNGAFDIKEPVRDFLMPRTTVANWNIDWLPFTIEEMCNSIVSAISSAAHSGKLVKK